MRGECQAQLLDSAVGVTEVGYEAQAAAADDACAEDVQLPQR